MYEFCIYNLVWPKKPGPSYPGLPAYSGRLRDGLNQGKKLGALLFPSLLERFVPAKSEQALLKASSKE